MTLQIHSERPPRPDRARDPENLKQIQIVRSMFDFMLGPEFDKHQSETQHVFKMLVHNLFDTLGAIFRAFGYLFGDISEQGWKSEICALVRARTLLSRFWRVQISTCFRA